MKKILFMLFAVVFVSSLCFAAQKKPAREATPKQAVAKEPLAPVSQASLKPGEAKTFTGKVALVSVGNEAKGITSDILVVDEKEQLRIFGVKPDTLIIAKDGKTLTLSEIKKNDKVVVEYKSVANVKDETFLVCEAIAIKLVE